MSYNQLINYQGTTTLTMSLDTTRRDAVFEAIKVSRKTFNAWWKKLASKVKEINNSIFWVATFSTDKFMCFMPFEVWDKFAEVIEDLAPKTKNIYTRVYLYIYMNISAQKGLWGHSIEAIARELKMNHSLVSSIVINLEECGLIERSSYSAEEGMSRKYALPEALWDSGMQYRERKMKKVLRNH